MRGLDKVYYAVVISSFLSFFLFKLMMLIRSTDVPFVSPSSQTCDDLSELFPNTSVLLVVSCRQLFSHAPRDGRKLSPEQSRKQ